MRLLFLPLVLLPLASCGTKSSSDGTTTTTATSTDAVSTTGSLTIDSATDALSEGSTPGTTGLVEFANPNLNLTTTADTDITVSRACTANKPATGNAEVVWTRTGTGTLTKTLPRTTRVTTVVGKGSETRDWVAPSGKTVSCNNAGAAVRVDWSDTSVVNGLTMTATVDRSHEISTVFTVTKTSATYTLVNNNATKGKRVVTWATPTVAAASGTTTITMNKSITLDHTTTVTRTPAIGSATVTKTTGVKTDDGAPLSVSVVRSGSTVAGSTIQSVTVNSGTVVATDQTDNSVTKSTFGSLKYDLTSSNTAKCIPVSGTISGKVYANAAAVTAGTTSKTYVITFGSSDASIASGVTIAYDDGAAVEYQYSNDGCDLAREM